MGQEQLNRGDWLGILGLLSGACAVAFPIGALSRSIFLILALALIAYSAIKHRTVSAALIGSLSIGLALYLSLPAIFDDLSKSPGASLVMNRIQPWHLLILGMTLSTIGLLFTFVGFVWQRPQRQPASVPLVAELPSTRSFTARTPGQIMGLYKGLSPLQANKLIEPFKGEWIKVELTIIRILPDSTKDRTFGEFNAPDGTLVECRFDERWIRQISQTVSGDTIRVVGKIAEYQNGARLFLEQCELD